MSVAWSETAADQLRAAHDHLARTSPGHALALAERIVSRTVALNGQPLLGAEVPEYGDPAIREVFEHPYRIVYQLSGPIVRIIAVIHSSRRMPRTPPN